MLLNYISQIFLFPNNVTLIGYFKKLIKNKTHSHYIYKNSNSSTILRLSQNYVLDINTSI